MSRHETGSIRSLSLRIDELEEKNKWLEEERDILKALNGDAADQLESQAAIKTKVNELYASLKSSQMSTTENLSNYTDRLMDSLKGIGILNESILKENGRLEQTIKEREAEAESYKNLYNELSQSVVDMAANRTGAFPTENPTHKQLLEAIDNQDIDHDNLEKDLALHKSCLGGRRGFYKELIDPINKAILETHPSLAGSEDREHQEAIQMVASLVQTRHNYGLDLKYKNRLFMHLNRTKRGTELLNGFLKTELKAKRRKK